MEDFKNKMGQFQYFRCEDELIDLVHRFRKPSTKKKGALGAVSSASTGTTPDGMPVEEEKIQWSEP